MIKTLILLADGFEEIEALTPRDVLNRAEIECDLVSIKNSRNVIGSHGVELIAEKMLAEIQSFNEYQMVILPGGMPGSKNLAECEAVINLIREFNSQKKFIAAICAAPALVLSRAGIINNKRATSYPGMDEYMSEAIYQNENVVIDENIITSRGPATALEFSYNLVQALGQRAEPLKTGMLFNR